eukprot:Plantae.Rhodophyta-Hildenbrandia_rubra.ctg15036.p1 GENE.Plantae.Rhodophyta-Hildenbrandia_rubra.ctg15036~~Plantae.Rhodophyta-Hildenbrandia_rubra.ctg15036.p1  ORF type:complete len:411 (+),score=73.72 Plantae.Rhodophyta-Hildenbrandia_rubra.ctg15036:1693-2925(+)
MNNESKTGSSSTMMTAAANTGSTSTQSIGPVIVDIDTVSTTTTSTTTESAFDESCESAIRPHAASIMMNMDTRSATAGTTCTGTNVVQVSTASTGIQSTVESIVNHIVEASTDSTTSQSSSAFEVEVFQFAEPSKIDAAIAREDNTDNVSTTGTSSPKVNSETSTPSEVREAHQAPQSAFAKAASVVHQKGTATQQSTGNSNDDQIASEASTRSATPSNTGSVREENQAPQSVFARIATMVNQQQATAGSSANPTNEMSTVSPAKGATSSTAKVNQMSRFFSSKLKGRVEKNGSTKTMGNVRPKKLSLLQAMLQDEYEQSLEFINSKKEDWSDDDLYEYLSLGFDGEKIRGGDAEQESFLKLSQRGEFDDHQIAIDRLIFMEVDEQVELAYRPPGVLPEYVECCSESEED